MNLSKPKTCVLLLVMLTVTLGIFFQEAIHSYVSAVSNLNNLLGLTSTWTSTHNTTLFRDDFGYQSLTTEADKLWNGILTPNGGYIYRDDSKMSTRRPYGISMFHQLHCLQMIRRAFIDAMQNSTSTSFYHSHTSHTHTREVNDGAEHLMHCFDYIRQVRRLLPRRVLMNNLKTECLSRGSLAVLIQLLNLRCDSAMVRRLLTSELHTNVVLSSTYGRLQFSRD